MSDKALPPLLAGRPLIPARILKTAGDLLDSHDKTNNNPISQPVNGLAAQWFSEAAYQGAIQKRGLAFIEAAKLIIKNRYDPSYPAPQLAELQNQDPLNKLEAIQKKWETIDKTLDSDSLASLVKLLCESITIAFNNKDKQTFKKLLHELNNADNHYHWRIREPVQSITVLDEHNIQVRIDEPLMILTQDQTKQWLEILKDKPNQPTWFKKLSPWEQNYLIKKVSDWKKNPQGKNLGEVLGTPSTTIRGYPGARNGYRSYILNCLLSRICG